MAARSQEERIFLSTTPGLEQALETEARALGTVDRVEGGIEVRGPAGLHRRANLELRTATRVLLRLGFIRAAEPRTKAFSQLASTWPLNVLSAASLRAEVRGAPVRANELVHDFQRALRFTSQKGADEVLLRATREGINVSVDTTGELLHKRGYRQEISHAPLRETLAAGMLMLAGFREDEPLLDPMCGSGTLLIEAALIATHRAPGLQRSFAFEQWKSHDADAWAREKDAASSRIRKAPAALIGTDIHAGALGTARRNARRAGVVEQLKLDRRDVRDAKPPEASPPGLVIANPPYGIRVGEKGDLPSLYRSFGVALRTHFRGWRAAVLVPDPKLGAALALPKPQIFEVENGGIRCQLQVAPL